jgi:hypothetical protein
MSKVVVTTTGVIGSVEMSKGWNEGYRASKLCGYGAMSLWMGDMSMDMRGMFRVFKDKPDHPLRPNVVNATTTTTREGARGR